MIKNGRKNRRNSRRKTALIMCAFAVMQLAGCGKLNQTIDNYGEVVDSKNQKEDGQTENDKKENTDSKENTYGIKGNGIPSHVTYNMEKDRGHKSLEIDADVISEGYKDARIYEATFSTMSEEEVKAFADNFFDNGKYESVLPYSYWSDEDRAAEKAKWEEMVTEAGENYEMHECLTNQLGYNVNRVPASELDPVLKPEEGKLFYHISRSDAVGYKHKEVFAILRGTVDGLEYELNYWGDEEGYNQTIRIVPLYPITNSISVGTYIPDLLGEENTCDTSVLENKASELVNALTENYTMSGSEDRVCFGRGEEKHYFDGKVVHFSLNLPDLSPSLCECMLVGKKSHTERFDENGNRDNSLFFNYDLIPQQYINVEMDADGKLLSLDYENAMVPGEMVGESIQMLEFKEVMKCLDTFLDGFADPDGEYSNWDSEQICEIRLTYLPELSDNTQVYMPNWVFLTKNKRGEGNTGTPYLGTFAVNAIDGSVSIMKYYPRY